MSAAARGAQTALDVFQAKRARSGLNLDFTTARLHQGDIAAAGADLARATDIVCADVAAARTGFYVMADVLQFDVAGAGAERAIGVDVKSANVAGAGLGLHGALDGLDGLRSGSGAQIGARFSRRSDFVTDGDVVAEVGIFDAADANDVPSLLNGRIRDNTLNFFVGVYPAEPSGSGAYARVDGHDAG